jgi:hypothetical protein
MKQTRRCDSALLALGRAFGIIALGGFFLHYGLAQLDVTGDYRWRQVIGGGLVIGWGLWNLANYLFSSISLNPTTGLVELSRSPFLWGEDEWAGDRSEIAAVAVVPRQTRLMKPLRLELELTDGRYIPVGTFKTHLGVEDQAFDLASFLGTSVHFAAPRPASE